MILPVSVKGVILDGGRFPLLLNERAEWELPGGRLEPGETPADCLAREIMEELGARVQVEAILDAWLYEVLPGRSVFIVSYLCTLTAPADWRISDEHRALRLCRLVEIEDLPLPAGYRRSIRLALARGD